MKSNLSGYFSGVGAKRLAEVEIRPSVSNQHELNGIADFKEIFGSDRICFKGKFIYLPDNEDYIVDCDGSLTWYDARENHPSRSEYRLFFTQNQAIDLATTGDLVIICRTATDRLTVFIAPQGSTSEGQLLWLFGMKEVGTKFLIKDLTIDDSSLNYAGRYIISSLGIDIYGTETDFLNELIDKYGEGFPSTNEFSAFTRSTLKDISATSQPDLALISWMEQEVVLFKNLEKHLIGKRLNQGFKNTDSGIEEFISYSLSVQNRRKSRAGFAFENHLSHIFDKNTLRYSRGARTERNNKPDFLFPGIKEYHNSAFSEELLTMLGVKTTAKERWRQVLSEADRIPKKHLITLEPAISKNQTDEMMAKNLQLVIPNSIITTYKEEQKQHLISLGDFIQLMKEKQNQM